MMIALIAAVTALAAAPAASDGAPPAGHVIVARTEGDALLIWDASNDVAAIVTDKAADDVANARLQRDGLRVLAASLNKLERSAKTVTLRIIFERTGAVSPVYGAPTLADVERYATLTAPASDLFGDRDKWRELTPGKPLPRWFTFAVIGRLPPR